MNDDPSDYPDLFLEYLLRGLQSSLKSVRNNGDILADATREDALHLLNFSFQIDNTWLITKDLLLAMAPKMELAGFRDDWIGYLQQGVKAGDRVLDHTTTAELCFQIGYLYRLLSKFDEAIRWLNECLAGANQPQHSALKAKALNQLAYVAWQQHKYDQAMNEITW